MLNPRRNFSHAIYPSELPFTCLWPNCWALKRCDIVMSSHSRYHQPKVWIYMFYNIGNSWHHPHETPKQTLPYVIIAHPRLIRLIVASSYGLVDARSEYSRLMLKYLLLCRLTTISRCLRSSQVVTPHYILLGSWLTRKSVFSNPQKELLTNFRSPK